MNEEEDTARIAIRLEGREPIRGVVEAGGAERPQGFVGWLGLLKVLEGSLAAEEEDASSKSTEEAAQTGEQHV